MSVRSKYTGRKTRTPEPARHKVKEAPEESKLVKFAKWYYAHMEPEVPKPADVKKSIRAVEKMAAELKSGYRQDDDYILPGRAMKKQAHKPTESKKKTRIIRIRRVK